MRILILLTPIIAALAISQVSAGSFPTQTPDPTGLPAAPTDLLFLGGIFVSWTDNADNEDGFRLTYRVGGGDVQDIVNVYEIPADADEFTLPDDAPRLCSSGRLDDPFYFMDAELVAYNDAGKSEADRYAIVVECGEVPSPTPAAAETPAPQLPSVGGAETGAMPQLPVALTIVGIGLALVAIGWRFRPGQ